VCRLPGRYLYTSKSTGVQDYICNRIYTLPEAGIERYLSQMVTLLVSRPDNSGALERCVVDLCGRSLRLAVKVNWYLQVRPWPTTGPSSPCYYTHCTRAFS
jgi:hypothetical protein